MYESFYGFTEKPFSLVPDPDFIYLGKKHKAAYGMLEYGLMNRAGFTVITGVIGSGKTTLVQRLLDNIADDITVGLINNTPRNMDQILKWVLLAFEQDYREDSEVALYDTFRRFLHGQHAQNKRTVLIIDEAQNLRPQVLEELRMLSNIQADKHPVLQMILVGQPGLLALLRHPALLQFRQRVASSYFLKPLDRSETADYIRHRTRQAGVERSLFLENAVDLVYQASRGVPRVINVLCDTALVYGFAEEQAQIGAEMMRLVLIDQIRSGLIDLKRSDDSKKQPAGGKTPAGKSADERQGKDINSPTGSRQDTVKLLFSGED